MTGKTNRERQQEFREARKAEGMTLLREWVPLEFSEALSRVASELRFERIDRTHRGMELVIEWVPKQCAETLRRIAAEMRSGRQAHTSTGPSAPLPKPSGTFLPPKE